jgi:hypothetical protein
MDIFAPVFIGALVVAPFVALAIAASAWGSDSRPGIRDDHTRPVHPEASMLGLTAYLATDRVAERLREAGLERLAPELNQADAPAPPAAWRRQLGRSAHDLSRAFAGLADRLDPRERPMPTRSRRVSAD